MTNYNRIYIKSSADAPEWWTPEQHEVNNILSACAADFASQCRSLPNRKFESDHCRQPSILYNRGLGEDEATAFLRAYQHGLIEIKPDSNFLIPKVRACSPNLHLLSRNVDHFRVNTEVLIHVGAYAELVLDRGWEPDRIAFDPFFDKDALDLWGYAETRQPNLAWRDGRIVFVAEAKARVSGSDSLPELLSTFEALQKNPSSTVGSNNHRRKWAELVQIVGKHGTVQMLFAADGARWWFEARSDGDSVAIHRIR